VQNALPLKRALEQGLRGKTGNIGKSAFERGLRRKGGNKRKAS
jgi:hypothetical protein